jgi:hypothetical protein
VESWVWEYHRGADETDSQGLHTKTVGLRFQIQNNHFTNNGGSSPTMEIRCTSTVGGTTRYKAVFPTLARALTSNKLAQERFRNSAAGKMCASKSADFLLLINFLSREENVGSHGGGGGGGRGRLVDKITQGRAL